MLSPEVMHSFNWRSGILSLLPDDISFLGHMLFFVPSPSEKGVSAASTTAKAQLPQESIILLAATIS